MAGCSSLTDCVLVAGQSSLASACSSGFASQALEELLLVKEHFRSVLPKCVLVALPLAEWNAQNLVFSAIPPVMNGAHFSRLKSFFAGRYCVEKALLHTAAGRLLLRTLRSQSQVEGSQIFEHDERSYFYVPAHNELAQPKWPVGIFGSITHSPLFAACLLSKTSAAVCLGIDTECILESRRARNIQTRVASDEELERVLLFLNEQARLQEGCERDQLGRAVTLLFSAKEAIFKAYHARVGDFFGFSAFECVELAGTKLRFKCLAEFGARCRVEEAQVHYFMSATSVWCSVFHET